MGPLQGRISRRVFLQGLGVAGGAGAVLAAMEVLNLVAPAAEYKVAFDPPRTDDFSLRGRVNDTTVLVLGAGIAGLTAAYELEKAGYRCEIVEARARPGGRNWTIRGGAKDTDLDGVTQTARFADDLYMNAGPARIPQHHTTLDYCRELGVPVEPFVNANASSYYFNRPQRGAGGGRGAGPGVRRPGGRGRGPRRPRRTLRLARHALRSKDIPRIGRYQLLQPGVVLATARWPAPQSVSGT